MVLRRRCRAGAYARERDWSAPDAGSFFGVDQREALRNVSSRIGMMRAAWT